MSRLKWSEFQSSVPDELDSPVTIEHCKPGRAKLYITRTNYGAVAYCHHCNQSGYIPLRYLLNQKYIPSPRTLMDASRITSTSDNNGFNDTSGKSIESNGERGITEGTDCFHAKPIRSLPKDSNGNITSWNCEAAKIWILGHGISIQECLEMSICWSDQLQSIIFPMFRNGNLIGYQSRRFPHDPKYPKYLTKYFDANQIYDPFKAPKLSTLNTNIILVEDYISALKCSRILDSIPLLGVQLKDELLNSLLPNYDIYHIMLDNDNAQVRKAQIKIKDRLELYGKIVYSYHLAKDPKEYTVEELKQILLNPYGSSSNV